MYIGKAEIHKERERNKDIETDREREVGRDKEMRHKHRKTERDGQK